MGNATWKQDGMVSFYGQTLAVVGDGCDSFHVPRDEAGELASHLNALRHRISLAEAVVGALPVCAYCGKDKATWNYRGADLCETCASSADPSCSGRFTRAESSGQLPYRAALLAYRGRV